MEYIKKKTKILVKDDNGRIVQIIPETDSTSVLVNGEPLTDVLAQIDSGKANASHRHEISDIDELQTSLDGKEPLITEVSNEEIFNMINS